MTHTAPRPRQTPLSKFDNRSAEGRFMRRIREELIAYCGGGELSIVQKRIIERCAWLSLHIWILDTKVLNGKEMSEINTNAYVGLTVALENMLVRLEASVKAQALQTKPARAPVSSAVRRINPVQSL